ncbi:PorP/SprF family type IX secretion system membrane protein [Lacihabitans lacunae]|jgi:type IX secretion system PorP/SprF family membrane protein|uniref:Type IX secretion system membrane protein PorP/SprF n=1 Tax=Lacihabitans lacunae TaxID=1028214 RepID=A0ABV7Z0N8_9BACT
MMKNFISIKVKALLIAGLCFSNIGTLFAQQEVMYSQYMFNTLAINPAYAGSRDVLSLTALGRYQWLERNIPGSPTTYSFTLDMPIKNEKMGLGLIAYNDAIGVANNTGLNLAYSYRFKLGAKTTMSLGLQPTVTNVSLALSQVKNLIDLNDQVFIGGDQNKFLFNAGLGMFISNDKSYFGFSVPQLLEQKIDPNSVSSTIKRHYFAMMGFVIGKGNFKIKPSTMLRYTNGSPLGVDGNINFWFKDKISFGISGRKSQTVLSGRDNIDAVVGMFELQLTPQIRVGYAYDYNNNRLNTSAENSKIYNKLVGTPTHEWLLRYEFGYGKSKILTPRYF